jgi:hypothetical protein
MLIEKESFKFKNWKLSNLIPDSNTDKVPVEMARRDKTLKYAKESLCHIAIYAHLCKLKQVFLKNYRLIALDKSLYNVHRNR